jgi:hypothetical protein
VYTVLFFPIYCCVDCPYYIYYISYISTITVLQSVNHFSLSKQYTIPLLRITFLFRTLEVSGKNDWRISYFFTVTPKKCTLLDVQCCTSPHNRIAMMSPDIMVTESADRALQALLACSAHVPIGWSTNKPFYRQMSFSWIQKSVFKPAFNFFYFENCD